MKKGKIVIKKDKKIDTFDKLLNKIRKSRVNLGKNFDCVKFIHSNR